MAEIDDILRQYYADPTLREPPLRQYEQKGFQPFPVDPPPLPDRRPSITRQHRLGDLGQEHNEEVAAEAAGDARKGNYGSALRGAMEIAMGAITGAKRKAPNKAAAMKEYRSSWRDDPLRKPSTYDEAFFSLKPDILRDEQGNAVAQKDQLVPTRDIGDASAIAHRPDLIHRGISHEEYQNILKTGQIQSRGDYNIGPGQEGLTYYTTQPESAVSYASSFAPPQHKPAPGRDAYVVSVLRPTDDRIRRVEGTGEHEVGVTGAIPASDIAAIYRGQVIAHTPEYNSPGFKSAASSQLNWEKLPTKELARAQGWDVDNPLYVSALQPITEFQPHGKFMGHKGISGISLSDKPEIASRYLDRFGESGWVDGKPDQPFSKNMMQVYIRPGELREFTGPVAQEGKKIGMGHPLPEGYQWPKSLEGVDTAVFPDIITARGDVQHYPMGGEWSRPTLEGKEFILRDPTRVRSVNAEFDPAKKDSSDLMHDRGGAVKALDIARRNQRS